MKLQASGFTSYIIGLAISNILLYFAVLPLFSHGYFPMHDDTQVARVIAMGNALKEGQFPVRLVDGLGYGYGYPIFNFYSPLPYYTGGLLYSMGMDAIVSTKLMFLIPMLFGASFLYMFLAPVYGTAASVVGSLLFSYAPYHAVQIYVRGSVGEYWAIAFVPLLLLAIYQAKNHRRNAWIVIGSFAIGAILTSHTILAALVLSLYILFSVLFCLYQLRSRSMGDVSIYTTLFLILIGGLGLSAFFWLPAFVEMKYTGVSTMIDSASTGFYDHFICLSQLWNSQWGFGGSAVGCMNDGMSFKLGKIHVLFMFFSVVIYAWKRYANPKHPSSFQFFIGLGLLILSLFGTIENSSILWRLFPFTSLVQYPWRLLSIAMLASGIVGAYFITQISNTRIRLFITGVLIIGILVVNAKLFIPKYIYLPEKTGVFSVDDIKYRVSKISDEYLSDMLLKPTSFNEVPNRVITTNSNAKITILSQKSTYVKALIEHTTDDRFTFQKMVFPGWSYTIDGKAIKSDTIHGLPVFSVSKGRHQFEAVFRDTPIRAQGTIISVMTLLLLGGLLFYGKKTNT